MLFIDFMDISASDAVETPTSDTDGGGELEHTEAGAAAQAIDEGEDADLQVRACLPAFPPLYLHMLGVEQRVVVQHFGSFSTKLLSVGWSARSSCFARM